MKIKELMTEGHKKESSLIKQNLLLEEQILSCKR